MALTNHQFSFKSVLSGWPRGEPRSTSELTAHGVSPSRASALARSGWLDHLARGIYKLPGDTVDRDASLALLSRDIPGLHVGGKSALDLRGVRHNVGLKASLTLWGDHPAHLPAWFTSLFPSTYRATALFDPDLPTAMGLQPLPNGRPDVLVSVPERALLELLSDVGKGQSLAEARSIVDGLGGLRVNVLDELLSHTNRVKVLRLAEALGTAAGQPWAGTAASHVEHLAKTGWVAVTKSGERIDLRRR